MTTMTQRMQPDPAGERLFRLCPTCGGSGQVLDDRFGDIRMWCLRPCPNPDCQQLRVVEVKDNGCSSSPEACCGAVAL